MYILCWVYSQLKDTNHAAIGSYLNYFLYISMLFSLGVIDV